MIRATQAQVAYFLLQKNFLIKPAASLADLVRALGSLPAEPLTTLFLSTLVRSKAFRPADLVAALHQERRLIRARLMRSQRYLVPVESFAIYHVATARQRRQYLNSEFRSWGIENKEIERLGKAIVAAVGDEPLKIESIIERLSADKVRELRQTSRGGRVSTASNVTLALRWLTACGILWAGRDPAAGNDWVSESELYAPLNYWYPDLDPADGPAEAAAQAQVVRDYLAISGPATEADISFWTGFGKSETARAINALTQETTLALVEGIPGITILLQDQAQMLNTLAYPDKPVVNILPADDPFTTAHRASRSRYFRDQGLQRRVFSSSGAAKPTLVVDGQIVGVWYESAVDDPISWQLFRETDTSLEPDIRNGLARVAAFLQTSS